MDVAKATAFATGGNAIGHTITCLRRLVTFLSEVHIVVVPIGRNGINGGIDGCPRLEAGT